MQSSPEKTVNEKKEEAIKFIHELRDAFGNFLMKLKTSSDKFALSSEIDLDFQTTKDFNKILKDCEKKLQI